MSETINEMLADVSKTISVDDDKLIALRKLATQQIDEQVKIDALEEQLKEHKTRLHKLRTETIPDYMDEIGMESFTLVNKQRISVEPFYQCSIPKDRRDEAFKWLSDNGWEDLIKVMVSIQFGKSQYDDALELCQQLDVMGYPCAPRLDVHPMTLKGWVRMMAEEANEFPLDLFGAFIGRTTKIK